MDSFIAWPVICYRTQGSLGSTACNVDMYPIKENIYCTKIKFKFFSNWMITHSEQQETDLLQI